MHCGSPHTSGTVAKALFLHSSALEVALDKTVSRAFVHAAAAPVIAGVNAQRYLQSVGDVWDAARLWHARSEVCA